ncbi:hypothetical protein ACIBF5_30225 [Micromonospora sp. NPDC050417]|uniref:hypothetical protein n=1 Tax=Micromonospora sp. NPDC050417 TaxID=3364280 RepID=UPI0037AE134D
MIVFSVLSPTFLLIGIFTSPTPPVPAGELLPGTVVAVEPLGDSATVLIQVETVDGPVFCGIGSRDFPKGQAPGQGELLTVDYQPAGCAPPPDSDQLPRWFYPVLGGLGTILTVVYLWLVWPITYDAFVAAWVGGYIGGRR